MFDIGMSELLVVGTVALIVIGPKDLPELFRSLGRMTAKLRAMSREFSRAMEAAANESGVKDVADDLRKATSAKSMGLDAVKDAATRFENWDPLKAARTAGTPTKTAAAKPVTAAPGPLAAAPGAADAVVPDAAVPVADGPAAQKPMGPATKALSEAQAARKAVAREAADMLRRPVVAADPPAAKPRAKKPRVTAEAPSTPKAAAAPRKPKPKADA